MTVRGIVTALAGGALLAGLVAPPAPGQSGSDEAIDRRATQMVDRYVSALAQGDVAQLQALLGARAYGRRKHALEENAAYRAFLTERYAGATYRILDRRRLDPATYAVDVRIVLASSEEVVTRLLFSQVGGRLVISGETDPGL